MYKAKVEQVNGINVRAGGKWLRCIGNKNVRVGDLIWTDGRCVYGYEKESMTPLVATVTNCNFGVPLRCGDDFYYFDHKLNFVANEPNISGEITNNRKFVWGVTEKFIAGNCDNSNNIYTMVERRSATPYSAYSLVDIKMNGKVVTTIDTSKFCNECREKALALVPYEPVHYYANSYTNIVWAFIENLNNWAIVVSSKADAASNLELWEHAMEIAAERKPGEPDSDPYDVFYNIRVNYSGLEDHNAYVDEAYYIDAAGKQVQLLNGTVIYELNPHIPTGFVPAIYESRITSTNFNENISDFQFPMHDDFFLKMELLPLSDFSSAYFGFSDAVKLIVYSPTKDEIFNCYTKIFNNAIACETRKNQYLVSIFPQYRGVLEYYHILFSQADKIGTIYSPSPLWNDSSEILSKAISNIGLYVVQENNFEILEKFGAKLPFRKIQNSKHWFKKWHHRIKYQNEE